MAPTSLQIAPIVKDQCVKKIEKDQLIEFVQSIISKQNEVKEAFYALDLSVVKSLYQKWTHNLPMIHPFYAVKCNPNTSFLDALAALGSNFDCASRTEIEAVLSLGVSPDRIVYANLHKEESHIKYAASVGVNLLTFDSRDELEKIRKWHPKCSLLLRVNSPGDSKSFRPMGSKFGALPYEVEPLLKTAQFARLNVVGVTFHIGSGATDPRPFREAIAIAKSIFDTAIQLGMPKMHVLDIGGGFTANSQFDTTTSTVKNALEVYFPNEPDLIVIAEPGYFFAESSFTLATNIIGKRIRADQVREYWINDGTYGSFNGLVRGNINPDIICHPLSYTSNSSEPTCVDGLKTYNSTVSGPTCDPSDIILTNYQLPELEVGDWLVFLKFGAYTSTAGSNFNGFKSTTIPTYIGYSESKFSM